MRKLFVLVTVFTLAISMLLPATALADSATHNYAFFVDIPNVSQASNGDPGLVRAEYNAILPAFLPYVQLQPKALAGWASFDTRFGILKRPPNLKQAFALGLVPQR